ncbi:hypothetical protein [Zavarzinella formosa]|uniref:hypothetical protein n=1 Tax=Zavarzinella formosa TaxID=360055 RepID=UPI000495553F|nr:hypothetical protein [Zavarzinella formosa]
MAPFTFGDCPVCSKETRQRFLLDGDASNDIVPVICESCNTVLLIGDEGVVGQRSATERELAAIPARPVFSAEQSAELQEEYRRGLAHVDSWIQSGRPGLTAEMLSQMPGLARVIAKRGAQLPRVESE